MRRAIVLLAILTLTSLNACELFTGPDVTIQVQGTVTAADDGSPIAAAVKVTGGCMFSCTPHMYARTTTDDSGRYSLSFDRREAYCDEASFFLKVSAVGFRSRTFSGVFLSVTDPYMTCTEELQTIDIQLEREPT